MDSSAADMGHQEEILSVRDRVERRPTRSLGMLTSCGAHRSSESRPALAYRTHDTDIVRLKTSLYPEMDFSEGC